MDELRTTPHDFIWRVKNPQDYWADTLKRSKVRCLFKRQKKRWFYWSQ